MREENNMRKEPTLIVMAAGMGSRYGGLKQIDPIGPNGEIIIDYSIYDAVRAGFKRVVFIIKRELYDTFKEVIGERISKYIKVDYVFQELSDLPEGYEVPVDRVKPWGTGHAVMAARKIIDGPFAVINADDFYGPGAFSTLYDFLSNADDEAVDVYPFALAGYTIENTLTDNGTVARGVCEVQDGYMTDITEHTKIAKYNDHARYTPDDGATWIDIPHNAIVSMNTWGFTSGMMTELENRFSAFLDKAIAENPLKAEYFLPFVVDELIKEGRATVRVLESGEKWYGVTYKEDKPTVCEAIKNMMGTKYPKKLWE